MGNCVRDNLSRLLQERVESPRQTLTQWGERQGPHGTTAGDTLEAQDHQDTSHFRVFGLPDVSDQHEARLLVFSKRWLADHFELFVAS
jgi:hypothetical protein